MTYNSVQINFIARSPQKADVTVVSWAVLYVGYDWNVRRVEAIGIGERIFGATTLISLDFGFVHVYLYCILISMIGIYSKHAYVGILYIKF